MVIRPKYKGYELCCGCNANWESHEDDCYYLRNIIEEAREKSLRYVNGRCENCGLYPWIRNEKEK